MVHPLTNNSIADESKEEDEDVCLKSSTITDNGSEQPSRPEDCTVSGKMSESNVKPEDMEISDENNYENAEEPEIASSPDIKNEEAPMETE